MASSTSTHQIAIKGVDQTKGAFSSIRNGAKGLKTAIAAIVGAGVAAGAGLIAGMKSLGNLSDIAMKAGMTTDSLTGMATALDVIGIRGMGMENIANAMAQMQKNTGMKGMEGFTRTLSTISQIEDASERAKAAQEAFGRSGLSFLPIINSGPEAIRALNDIQAAMPRVAQAAADAGDNAADGLSIALQGIKSTWLNGIGSLLNWVMGEFGFSFREAGAQGAAWLEFYAKKSFVTVKHWFSKLWMDIKFIAYDIRLVFSKMFEPFEYAGAMIGGLVEGGLSGAAQALEQLKAQREIDYSNDLAERARYREENEAPYRKMLEEDAKRQASWKKTYDERIKKAKELDENTARIGSAMKGALPADAGGAGSASAASVRNDLIMGATQQALKLAMMGPQTSEQRQTNNWLEKIHDKVGNIDKNVDDPDEKEHWQIEML